MAIGFARRSTPQSRQQKVIIKTLPAPTGGVNARDALADMPVTDAVAMTNWFPTPSYVAVRNGSLTWATGLAGAVETVMAFNGLVARNKYAIAGGSIYDVTAQGAVGAALVSGLSNSRWQHAMFNAGGGNTLIAVNGADAPRRYDGNTQGSAGLLENLTGGSGYTNGSYTNVPLTGGTGSGAQASVTVAGGAVTSVVLTLYGSGYLVGDTLSCANASIGGTGSGFSIEMQTVGGWSVTTISGTNTITGLALVPSNLITVTIFQQRVWYIEANTMNCWYGAVSAYQGTLTLLPLGQVFKKGGCLVQMATWTIDNVDGINDYAAFITSEGEVAVYQGYDPSSIATWSLVGTFNVGLPIGTRCIVKFGSDVLVICDDGLEPLSKMLLTDRSQPDAILTNKIINAINQDVQSYGSNFGWQVVEYPLGQKLILNVPEVVDVSSHQWVMNTTSTSNAWTKFTGWNAFCWEIQDDSLFFGGLNAVYQADTGTSDSNTPITVDCKQAFSYFDYQQQKTFMMARPVFRAATNIGTPTILLNIDYDDVINPAPLYNNGSRAPWNTSPWNTTPWGGSSANLTIKNWNGVSGIGYTAAGRLTFQLINSQLQWQSTDYMYVRGGPL